MLTKGTALPAVRERAFRTARALQPGRSEDILNVHVVEGESNRPGHNRHVGYLSISGSEVKSALPIGTPVDVKLRVDSSRGIVARAYIPLLDLTIENVLEEHYLPTPDPVELETSLDSTLSQAHEVAADRDESLEEIKGEAREIQRDLAAAETDPDAVDRADRRLKELQEAVDRLGAQTASQRLSAQIDKALAETREVVEEADRADYRRRFELLETATSKALHSGDPQKMQRALSELDSFYWSVLMSQPSFWVDCFTHIEETIGTDADEHAQRLLERGRQALADYDDETLRKTCIDLWQVLTPREQAATGLENIGIHV
jgi:molecular chaperone DnaK (HSP70)